MATEDRNALPDRPTTGGGLESMSRRRFLELGAAAAGTALAGSVMVRSPRLLPSSVAAAPTERSVRTACGLCVNKCGVIARVRGDVVHKLDPIPDHPKSHGMLCARGNSGVQVLYDPNRLKAPLLRNGPRGSGQWRQVSWDEALDFVAEGLQRIRDSHGPQGVLFSSTEGFQEHFFRWFADTWGSPNVVRHPTLCLASMINGAFNTFGTVPEYDFRNTRYVIIPGANRFESLVTPDSVDLMRRLGTPMHVVVLDPRFTITASKADDWLPIRPGTDLAFVLAMLHVIVGENRHDAAFVERYTHGFEELREHVKAYTPEWAASECGVPAATIRRIAREFATEAPRAIFYLGRRSSWNRNDSQLRRAIAIVNAVVGSWDRPGGLLPKASIPLEEPDIFPPDDIEVACVDELPERFPIANQRDGSWLNMREHLLALPPEENPLRGWLIYKQNPLHSVPNSRKTLDLIERMDLVVSIDTMPSDTAWMSDVILPESVYLERDDPPHSIAGAVPVVGMRRQVVPPRYDTRPCLDIMKGLAERLGLAEYFDFTIEDWYAAALSRLPVDRETFESRGFYTDRREPAIGTTLRDGYRFRTPTGKIELYATRYAKNGYDPLPVYKPPSPVPAGSYRLLTGRSAIYTHSSLQNVRWLADEDPDGPRVWLHPKVAERHGVRDGDWIGLRSAHGEARAPVMVTERIRPDCVFVPHGWGHVSAGLSPRARRGPRASDLLGSEMDEISGNAALHETAVELFPVPGHPLDWKVPVSTRRTEGAS